MKSVYILIFFLLNYFLACAEATEQCASQNYLSITTDENKLIEVTLNHETLSDPTIKYEFHGAALQPTPESGTQINYISDKQILFGAITSNNFTYKNVLAILDIKDGVFSILREGSNPTYLPKQNKIFFYDKTPEGHNEPYGAYIGILANGEIANAHFIGSVQIVPWASTVLVDDEDIVFYNDETGKTYLLNSKTEELKELRISDGCYPQGFRNKTNDLICRSAGQNRYFLFNLDTLKIINLKWKNHTVFANYIECNDSAILSVMESNILKLQEQINYYIYNFETKKMILIKRDLWVSAKSFVRLAPGQ